MIACVPVAACAGHKATLTELIEARDAAAALQLHFTKATEAANRAVMADTDATSESAAHEAERATRAVVDDVAKLRPLLQALGFQPEQQALDAFDRRFAEARKIDADLLPLAVENTNLKAQRLLFGRAGQASDEVRGAAAALGAGAPGASTARADAAAAHAAAAVLEVQVILARHIAEADVTAMARMEDRIDALEAAADGAVTDLGRLGRSPHRLATARAALASFRAVVAEITRLSRRNSNVRSLSLALGRKRTVTMRCDEHLRELAAALQSHAFTATR